MTDVKPCSGRHHDYAGGATCRKCGAPKKGPGRPPGARTQKPKAGEGVASRLAATLAPVAPSESATAGGQEKPAAPMPERPAAPSTHQATTSQPATAPPVTYPEPSGWCRPAGKRLTQLFVAACDWTAEKMRRKANEPDEDDEEDFARAMGQSLAIWFPDTAMTPAKQLILSGAFIAGGMWIGSEKLPPPPPTLAGVKESKDGKTPNGAQSSAHAAPTTSDATRPPS